MTSIFVIVVLTLIITSVIGMSQESENRGNYILCTLGCATVIILIILSFLFGEYTENQSKQIEIDKMKEDHADRILYVQEQVLKNISTHPEDRTTGTVVGFAGKGIESGLMLVKTGDDEEVKIFRTPEDDQIKSSIKIGDRVTYSNYRWQ